MKLVLAALWSSSKERSATADGPLGLMRSPDALAGEDPSRPAPKALQALLQGDATQPSPGSFVVQTHLTNPKRANGHYRSVVLMRKLCGNAPTDATAQSFSLTFEKVRCRGDSQGHDRSLTGDDDLPCSRPGFKPAAVCWAASL